MIEATYLYTYLLVPSSLNNVVLTFAFYHVIGKTFFYLILCTYNVHALCTIQMCISFA